MKALRQMRALTPSVQSPPENRCTPLDSTFCLIYVSDKSRKVDQSDLIQTVFSARADDSMRLYTVDFEQVSFSTYTHVEL